jgi:hypothetical protein
MEWGLLILLLLLLLAPLFTLVDKSRNYVQKKISQIFKIQYSTNGLSILPESNYRAISTVQKDPALWFVPSWTLNLDMLLFIWLVSVMHSVPSFIKRFKNLLLCSDPCLSYSPVIQSSAILWELERTVLFCFVLFVPWLSYWGEGQEMIQSQSLREWFPTVYMN